MSDPRTERPESLADLAALVRGTSGSMLVRGGGTQLDWGGRVDPVDLVVDTGGLRDLLTYNPADLTASIGAGTPLAAFQARLASDRLLLALDPDVGEAATIGGLLATGDSGPARLRYGSLREQVIGVTLVLADGTVARSGGHVIKNVAGYDLAKLMHGSLGAFAIVAEIVVRLAPRPAASLTVAVGTDIAAATRITVAAMTGPVEPVAVEWISASEASTGTLLVRLEGGSGAVHTEAGRVADLARQVGRESRVLDGVEAVEAWSARTSAVRGGAGDSSIRVAVLPADLGSVTDAVDRAAADAGVLASSVAALGLGTMSVLVRGGTPAGHAQVLAAARDAALGRGGTALVRSRPTEVDDHLDPLGPPPASLALLRSVKHQFDPDGRLSPGRFRPWL